MPLFSSIFIKITVFLYSTMLYMSCGEHAKFFYYFIFYINLKNISIFILNINIFILCLSIFLKNNIYIKYINEYGYYGRST